MSYAENTSVPVERSKAEIERMLTRYGADKFMVGSDQTRAMLAFQIHGKMVQFTLPLPGRTEKRFTHYKARASWHEPKQRTEQAAFKEWEQACRQRWRALALCIKAKLEAVECGITSFESEFLAHFVTPNGQTIGERIIPQLEQATKEGHMPQLLLTQS